MTLMLKRCQPSAYLCVHVVPIAKHLSRSIGWFLFPNSFPISAVSVSVDDRARSSFPEPEERAKDSEEGKESEEERAEEAEETEEQDVTEYTEDISYSAYSDEHLRIVQPSEDEGEEETETQELEGTLSVKSEEGSRVKKFVVSYETKVLKSPSPAPSHGKYQSLVGFFFFFFLL